MRRGGWLAPVLVIALLAGCPQREETQQGGGGGEPPPVDLPRAPNAQNYHDRVARAALATGNLQDALGKGNQTLAEHALSDARTALREAKIYVPRPDIEHLLEAQDLAVRAQAALADHSPTTGVAARDLMATLVNIQESYGARPVPVKPAVPVTAALKEEEHPEPAKQQPVHVIAHVSPAKASRHLWHAGGGGGAQTHPYTPPRIYHYPTPVWPKRHVGELPGTTPNSGAPQHLGTFN
jgi:hypothetical protein